MAVAAICLIILGNWNAWFEQAIEVGFENVIIEMKRLGDVTFFPPKSPYAGSYFMGVFVIIMESLSEVVSSQKDLVIYAAALSLYCVVFKGSYLTATRKFVIQQVCFFFLIIYEIYFKVISFRSSV
jgi:hypothetical protein